MAAIGNANIATANVSISNETARSKGFANSSSKGTFSGVIIVQVLGTNFHLTMLSQVAHPVLSLPMFLPIPKFSQLGVTQLDLGAAAKPPARAVLTPYKGCFRSDYRPPLHKMTSTA